MHPFDYRQLWLAWLAPACDDIPAGGSGELLTPEQTSAKQRRLSQAVQRDFFGGKGKVVPIAALPAAGRA